MSEFLFDNACFGDRYLDTNGDIVIYVGLYDDGKPTEEFITKEELHNVVSRKGSYFVNALGEQRNLFGLRGRGINRYDVVSRVVDDEDFIDAIAVKECPFDEYEYGDSYYADDYKAAFKDGFKKALNIRF